MSSQPGQQQQGLSRRQRRAERRRANSARRKNQQVVVRAPNSRAARRPTPQHTATKRNIARQYPMITRSDHAGMRLNRFMMMPLDGQPVRLPTRDAPSVALTTMRYVSQYNESFADSDVFGGKSYLSILYGQPGCTYVDGPFNLLGKYVCAFNKHPTDIPQATVDGLPNPNAWISGPLIWDDTLETGLGVERDKDMEINENWPLARVDVPTAWQEENSWPEHQPVLEAHGRRWMFIHSRDTIEFHGQLTGEAFSAQAGCTLFLEAHVLTPTGPVNTNDYSAVWSYASAPTGAFSKPLESPLNWFSPDQRPTFGAWVSFSLKSIRRLANEKLTRVAMSFTISAEKNNSRLRFHYAKDLTAAPTMAREMRRTACTLLVSNYSNDYAAQGNLLCARMLPGLPGVPVYKEFIDARGGFSGKAKDGCFTYSEFAFEDEHFQNHLTELGGPLCRPQLTMSNMITIANPGRANLPNMYQITCDIGLEFKTSSQLFLPLVSAMSPNDLDFARRVNNSTVWFFENPKHFDTIWRYIVAAWNTARQNSTAIGSAASLLFPEAAPVIMPIARALQKRRN